MFIQKRKRVVLMSVIRKLFTGVLVISMLIIYSPTADALTVANNNLRIGLNFASTSVNYFSVSAEKGLQVGSSENNVFKVLHEEATSNSLVIRKDSYLTTDGSKYISFNPSDVSVPLEKKIGPFHIKIGSDYQDLGAAKEQVTALTQKGIKAYCAYVDSWQVWAGFYIDQNSAQADIDTNFKSILPEGTYTIVQPSDSRIVVMSGGGETLLVFGSSKGKFQIRPKTENNPCALKINNKDLYRGNLEVLRSSGSDMTLINIVPLEQYLYGVVPAEIGKGVHLEAAKAQAIVSRTYAINGVNAHGKNGFDLCTTEHCHVYKGYSAESPTTNRAVDETAGKSVVYNGKSAQVFYSSSNGGYTEDVKNVWNPKLEIPYLAGFKDKYDPAKPWEVTLTASQVKQKTKGSLGDILGISITNTSGSGRVTELQIKGTSKTESYYREACRTLFGFKSQLYTFTTDADVAIKSNNSSVKTSLSNRSVMTASGLKTLKGNSGQAVVLGADNVKRTVPSVPTVYKFTGTGYGHGIGMSQLGAIAMANAGFKSEEIVTYYFPGTTIG